MLTKTKGLLMQKLHQHRSGDLYPKTQNIIDQQSININAPVKLPKRRPIQISHVSQYTFIPAVIGKPQTLITQNEIKQLQIQNIKFLQEKLRMTEWIHNVMNKIREGIVKSIQCIQQFRYLEGVNLLHNFLEQMKQFGQNQKNQSQNMCFSSECDYLKGYANPQSKNTLLFDIKKLELIPRTNIFTYNPQKHPKSQKYEKQQFPIIVSHDKSKVNNRKQQNESQIRMLMTQSLAIQNFLQNNQYY